MKFLFNKTDIALAMFGGTLTIFGKSGAKVSDASAETDEVFSLERAGIIEIHDEVLQGVENKAPEPSFEFDTPPTHGSDVYPGKEVKEEVVEAPVEEVVAVAEVTETPAAPAVEEALAKATKTTTKK